MRSDRKTTFILILSFVIFGFTGITKHFVTAPTAFVSMLRAFGGGIALLLVTFFLRKKISFSAIKKNAIYLLAGGAALAVNWIMLFTAYELAGVGMATILDYMAPIIVFFLAPLIFKEKTTVLKFLIASASLLGVVMVGGAFSGAIDVNGSGFLLGVVFGLVAAVTYAIFIICNKKTAGIQPFDKGIAQMFIAGTVMIPYVLLKELPEIASYEWSFSAVLLILFFIFIQTGAAYGCYFYAIGDVPAQKNAILSFIDPAVTLLTAFLFLHESMDFMQAIGAAVILLSAAVVEIVPDRKPH